MGDIYRDTGPSATGIPPYIRARDNDPTRVQDPNLLRTLSVQPWDVNPIPSAINFFAEELLDLNLGANAGDTVVTTIAGGGAFQVPQLNIASIQAVALFCNAPALTTVITYTVRANQIPIAGLTNLKFPSQGATFRNRSIPGPFNVLSPGAYIDVLISRVVTDVVNAVNFTFLGWYASRQDIKRWTGAEPGQV